MRLHKPIHQRHHIKIAVNNGPIGLNILTNHISHLIDHQSRGKTIPLHIVIIAGVVHRQHIRDLALRQPDLTGYHHLRTVRLHLYVGNIMDADQHISPVIHLLHDLLKLLHRGHDPVVIVLILIAVKGQHRIHDQAVVKYVGDLLDGLPFHRRRLPVFVADKGFRHG